jgi:Protein of unknown function (DUF3040)
MSLSASEARTLSRIEQALLSRDPGLRSLFSTFTRLTWHEAMPAREQIRRRRRRPKPGALLLVAIALAVGMIIVSALNSVPRACAPSRAGVAIARTADRDCAAAATSAPPLTR